MAGARGHEPPRWRRSHARRRRPARREPRKLRIRHRLGAAPVARGGREKRQRTMLRVLVHADLWVRSALLVDREGPMLQLRSDRDIRSAARQPDAAFHLFYFGQCPFGQILLASARYCVQSAAIPRCASARLIPCFTFQAR